MYRETVFTCHEEDYATLSEQAMFFACRFALIESNLVNSNKPHTFFQLLKNFLETINTKDPHKVHYDIARNALHLRNDTTKNNIYCIDMLAREFAVSCQLLDERLKMPAIYIKLLKYKQTTSKNFRDPYLTVVQLPQSCDVFEDLFFTENGLSIWDDEYLQLLEKIGPTGIVRSTELREIFATHKNRWDALFWMQPQDAERGISFFLSPAFLELATILWEDKVKMKIVS